MWLIVEATKLETRLCAVMWPTSWCSANAKLFKNGAREERALPRQNGEASASEFLRLPKTLREILDGRFPIVDGKTTIWDRAPAFVIDKKGA
jgi:hypothetical protein